MTRANRRRLMERKIVEQLASGKVRLMRGLKGKVNSIPQDNENSIVYVSRFQVVIGYGSCRIPP